MEISKNKNKIPQTYLENIDMVNSATQFPLNYNGNSNNSSHNKDIYDLNLNIRNIKKGINRTNEIFEKNTFHNTNNFSDFSFTKIQNFNTSSNIKNHKTSNHGNIKTLKYINDLHNKSKNTKAILDDYNLNILNSNKKFAWKEIMNNTNNNIILDDIKNPLAYNILNGEINEKEIQNIPENYLINLIQTLQCVANKAIENKNNLLLENNKLNKDLSKTIINYNNIVKNNNKLNQTILNLNNRNNEQKNIIQNYENNNNTITVDNSNIFRKNIINIGHKKKYCCPYCSNKIFKTQQFLDEHINRRHSNYQPIFLKKDNYKELKLNAKMYEKNLNEMKKYFSILMNQFIKKARYIRLNEKLIGIQNLIMMSKFHNINNSYNYSDYNNNNNTLNLIQDKNISSNVKDNHENNEKIIKYNNKLEKTDKTDNDDENNEFNNLDMILKQVKNDMKQFYKKNIKEIVELNNEKKFQEIKKYFEYISEENQNENIPQLHSRRENKVKTTKIKKINLFSSHFDLDNQNPKEKIESENQKEETRDIFQEKNKKDKNYDGNKNVIININNDNEKFDLLKAKNKNKNEIPKINFSEKKVSNNKEFANSEKSEEENQNSKKEKKISFSDSESQVTEKNIALENFYKNFRNRDGCFSRGKDKYYLKKIIPEDYNNNLDQQKINSIIEEKVNKKLSDLKKTTNEDWISDIFKIYFQILDKNFIYGNVHLFYSRNMSNYLNIKKLVDDANNYYYKGIGIERMKNYSDISKVVNEKSTNVFEQIDYLIQNNEYNEDLEKNDFSFRV